MAKAGFGHGARLAAISGNDLACNETCRPGLLKAQTKKDLRFS